MSNVIPDKPKLCPFRVEVSDSVLAHIRSRVQAYPWRAMPELEGWKYGSNLTYMKELCDYWVNEFNWRQQEKELNKFPQFTTPIDGLDLHFIYEKGSSDNAKPLLIAHGWPGSIAEFKHIIEPLAHPERFGGSVDEAFDVVAPSLPGFGFSSAPARPWGPRRMAATFNTLMTDVLGYDSYIAQGGDWGGAICSWLAHDHASACKAIHINILTMRHRDGPQGPDEEKWAAQFDIDQVMQNGYRTQQATKPQTLGYAMMDSPVGVAAWIIEKFNAWSDTQGDDVESAHSRDDLLANIMIYLVTGTFSTATWIYFGRREEGGRLLSRDGKRVDVPTGCALFPKEMLAWPPRSYAERIYNIIHWSELPRGGHFGAMEEPDLLVDDIRSFVRKLG